VSDLAIKLTLSWHHRQMLRFLAERGGRALYNFGTITINSPSLTEEEKKKLATDADQSVRDMADKLHVVTMTPIVGTADQYELALTDAGRQVIEHMGLMVKPQTFTFDIKTKTEKKGIIQ